MQLFYEIPQSGQYLRGIIHKPQDAVKTPCVIMFPGFTGDRMEYAFRFVELSRMLERSGIASARFDFMGSGESDGDFINMTISGEVSDGVAILDFVRKLDFIDPQRVGVLGMSLGGVVASLLAGKYQEDVQCLALWAPAAIVTEDVRNGRIVFTKITEDAYRRGYFDINSLKLGTGFVQDALDIDIFETTAQFKKDVLLVHGTKDQVVPLRISEQYSQVYGGRAKLIKIEGAGHGFETIAYRELLLEKTLGFFVDHLRTDNGPNQG